MDGGEVFQLSIINRQFSAPNRGAESFKSKRSNPCSREARVAQTGGNSRGDALLRVFNSPCKGVCGSVRAEMLNWGWIGLLVFETKNTRFREAETMGTPGYGGL